MIERLDSGAGAAVGSLDLMGGRPGARFGGLFDSHLGLDAVVSYVDGELGPVAMQRACAHLLRCGECAGEVAEQAGVARSLQAAGPPRMPGSLFDALTAIPLALPGEQTRPGPMTDPPRSSAGVPSLRSVTPAPVSSYLRH